MNRRMDHVLVVDDDIELCALVQEYLTAEGFSLKAVHDGEQGLQQALTGDYALVVLDVMLPGINGFEVLRRIRSMSKIPVLLLTARGEDLDFFPDRSSAAGAAWRTAAARDHCSTDC